MSVNDPHGPRAAPASPMARLEPGTTLNDRYQIDELTGGGPYGQVYRGRDLADGRLVTIKTLAPALIADAGVRARLDREIQIAVQLDHKNVGQTYGLFGAMVGAEAIAYVASEYVDGQSLREMVERKRQTGGRAFSLKGAYNVIAHLSNALTYAHGATVHGALSPLAVLVNSAGRVKVVDWGIGRALRPLDAFVAQQGAGGLAALAPEAAQAASQIDARADVFSTGAILFELVAGRPPSDPLASPSSVTPGVPKALDQVVERCLRRSPAERYANAQQLKDALHAAVAHELGGEGAKSAPISRPAPVAPGPTALPARPAPPTQTPPPRQAASPGPISRPQMASVAKSFNVDSALSAVDDQTERWLIQKDRLDFGPFNMRDVRSQIEAGKIVGDHTIIDTENGERRKVKDHPQLRPLVMQAEASHAEKAREETEAADRRRQRGRVVTLLFLILLLVVGAGGGVTWYVTHMKPRVVKEVVHDRDEEWLKGIEISMKVDPPAPKKHPAGGHRTKNKNGQWDDSTTLGDASGSGGDDQLDQTVVQQVMTKNFRVLVPCIQEERHRNASMRSVDMDFIIKGSGIVSAVKVNGQTGTPLAGCMYGKMQSVMFPKFDGQKTHASFSLALK